MSETTSARTTIESSLHYAEWGGVLAAFAGVIVTFAPIVH